MLGEELWGAVSAPVHPKGIQWGLRSGLCAGHSSSSTPSLANHLFGLDVLVV